MKVWLDYAVHEWVHAFFHTFDEMSRYWYVLAELPEISHLELCFNHTFSFADSNLDVHNVLQLIHDVVLKVVLVAYPVDPHAHCHMQSMMECYNVSGKRDDDDL